MVKKRTTVLEHIILIYSLLSILYYATIIVFCIRHDYTVTSTEIKPISFVVCLFSILVKTLALFFVKKVTAVVVGASIIISAMYNCCTVIALSVVILGTAFVTALVLIITRCLAKNTIINIILPFVIAGLLFIGNTIFETVPITHMTTDMCSNLSETHVIVKDTYWCFNMPNTTRIKVIESDATMYIGHLMLSPTLRRGWTIYATSYHGVEKSGDIFWIDNYTFSINGEKGTVR